MHQVDAGIDEQWVGAPVDADTDETGDAEQMMLKQMNNRKGH